MNAIWIGIACFLAGRAFGGDDQRQQQAESSFDAIMLQNSMSGGEGHKAARAPAPMAAPDGTPAATTVEPIPPAELPATVTGDVEVPLPRYESVRAQITATRTEAATSYSTLVVLGASTYTGRAESPGLALHLQLQATLRGPASGSPFPSSGTRSP